MPSEALTRVRTAALHRGGSIAQRDQMLGNAIAHAMTKQHTMDEIMEAAKLKDVHKAVDLAAIGGFIATCTSDDFRDAARMLRMNAGNTLHGKAVAARVETMLRKMADHYDATVALNRQQERK